MRTSFYLSHPLGILCGIVLPLYLAFRISIPFSDVKDLVSSLCESAKTHYIYLSSTPAAPPSSMFTEVTTTSTQTAEAVRVRLKADVDALRRSLPDGLAHSINSFEQYPFLAEQVLQRKHARYVKQTHAQKMISDKLRYPAHFERARKGIDVNALFTAKISQVARETYNIGAQALEREDDAEFGLVDLAFGHLSRDWSSQGAREREAVFPPVLRVLEQSFGSNRGDVKVLVPGSGMGRLASDIADIGYDVTANELDYGSILTYHLLTDHTTSLNQHALQPFVSKWAHQANPSSRYTELTVPDHWPNKTVKLVEGDFLEVFPQDGQFDVVVTLFFIDMSSNVIDFLSNIHRLLKPGGVWINLGPLKWGSYAALQLSAEEVLELADLIGFDVDHESRQSIDSLYAEQPETLLKFTYVTQFWSATKRK